MKLTEQKNGHEHVPALRNLVVTHELMMCSGEIVKIELPDGRIIFLDWYGTAVYPPQSPKD